MKSTSELIEFTLHSLEQQHLFTVHDVRRVIHTGKTDWVSEEENSERAKSLIQCAARRRWIVWRSKYQKWEITSVFYLRNQVRAALALAKGEGV